MKLHPKLQKFFGLLVLAGLMIGILAACGDNTTAPSAPTGGTSVTTAASGGATTAAGGAAGTAASNSANSGANSVLGAIPKGPAQLSGPIVIALNTEITGAGSQTGDLARKAAEAAVEKINGLGGVNGQKIDLKVEDAASSNQGALAALNKASSDDKAITMVGPVKSTQILAISQRIKELEMLSLIGGTNESLTKAGNQWLFRLRPDDSITGKAMASYLLNELKATKIAIIHDSDAFGTGGADIIEAGLKAAGKAPVNRQKYSTGTQDFTAQLLAVKSSGADALALYSTNSTDGAVLLRQYKEQGLKIPVIGSPSYGQTVITSLPADLTDGVYVAQDYFPGRTPEYAEYEKAWRAKYNSEPDSLSAWNWDAIHLIARTVAQVGTDKNKLRETIAQTKDLRGVVGNINFDAQGNGLHSVDLGQYKGQKLTFVKTVAAQ